MSKRHPVRELENLTRNQQIVLCYRAGNSQEAIGRAFKLSHARINQILKAAGVSSADSPKRPRGDLFAFIGTNCTTDLKEAFVREARRRKTSVSALSAQLMEDELRRVGVIK